VCVCVCVCGIIFLSLSNLFKNTKMPLIYERNRIPWIPGFLVALVSHMNWIEAAKQIELIF